MERVGSTSGWNPRSLATVFWVIVIIAVPVMITGWTWYGIVAAEAMSEQCKALAADTTMADFELILGVVPLMVLHVLALFAVVLPAALGCRPRWAGVLLGVGAVAVVSLLGMGVAQIVFGGELLQIGVAHSGCHRP